MFSKTFWVVVICGQWKSLIYLYSWQMVKKYSSVSTPCCVQRVHSLFFLSLGSQYSLLSHDRSFSAHPAIITEDNIQVNAAD